MDQSSACIRLTEIIERYGLMNWMRGVKSDAEFLEFVEQQTIEHQDLPLKARVWIATTGDGPECQHGKTRKFANITDGWSFCSRGKECLCLAAHKSNTIGAARRAKVQEVASRAQNAVPISDEVGRDRLLRLIESLPKVYPQAVQRDPELLRWVLDRSASHPISSMSERCFLAINGADGAICELGNKRKFYSIYEGYENCCETNSHCECRRTKQAQVISKHQQNVTPEERTRRQEKATQTWQDRYGVSNPMLSPEVLKKQRQTMMDRHGVSYPMESAEIRSRIEATNLERYGSTSPLGSKDIQQKVVDTNMQRHGVPHTMDKARRAFTEQTGYENPFQHPDIKAKSEASMMARHGVPRALMSETIKEQMRERLLKVHGVTNVMKLETVRSQGRSNNMARYGRISPHQEHFSDETFAILQDGEKFRELFADKSLREVSRHLGIAYDTARKYCDKYEIELPKSSYEDAIVEFIRSLGVTGLVRGDRKLIKPQEIDIMIPSRKLCIEFCGLYWHRDTHLGDRLYHRKKMEAVEAKGYRLITIFEDEWLDAIDIVKGRIRHALGLSDRGAGGRQCEVRRIAGHDARVFLDKHHIQGGRVHGFANYGAFHDGALVAVMTFSKARSALGMRKGGPVEMLRFATSGANHPGVANRLFSAFVREFNPREVVSYADRRWSQGGLYRTLGFREIGSSERSDQPNYFYLDFKTVRRYHRYLFRKDKIDDLVEGGADMSEAEIMKLLGYERIYDCGSYKFVWKAP